MLSEVHEAPRVVEYLLKTNSAQMELLAQAIRDRNPHFAVTIARGSSDHASTFLKYALETQLGLVTASMAPSTVTVYGAKPRLREALVFAISQSGQSPDVAMALKAAREAGAITIAIVNAPESPLEAVAEFVLPMQAGTELAVAATKSFIASLTAPLQLIAHLAPNDGLQKALEHLSERLRETLQVEEEVHRRAERYRYAEEAVTLARGPHFAIALETALKLKETCRIHAEAFSAAEFAHGPQEVIEDGFPVLAFQSKDAAAPGTLELYKTLVERGAELILIGDTTVELTAPVRIRTPSTGHKLTDPITAVLASYLFCAHLSYARGLNPDAPRSLSKVTRTL